MESQARMVWVKVVGCSLVPVMSMMSLFVLGILQWLLSKVTNGKKP